MHVFENQPTVGILYKDIVELCNFVLRSINSVVNSEDRSYSPAEIEAVWNELLQKTTHLILED